MRKVTCILLLLWPAFVLGQGISPQTARLYASEWLKRNLLATQYEALHGTPLAVEQVELLQLRPADPTFYLVHLYPEGYIIMHSDLRLKPVLYFSFSGHPDLRDRHDNALHQLLILQGQVDRRRLTQAAEKHSANSLWDFQIQYQPALQHFLTATAEPQVVGPLLQTLWNQTKYYNKFCPIDPNADASYDGRAPTGCVSTAFAQILKYHEWPYRGTGSLTYEDTQGDITGEHTAVFSDTYEWRQMQNEYYSAGFEPPEEANAVSELMYELGVAARMNYEHDGSSASASVLARELPGHFRYESPSIVSDANLFTDLLISDLNEARPCAAGIPGHQVVLDGYMHQGDDVYFHVNFGWGGTNDGWYLLDNTHESPVGQIVTGIRPALNVIPADSIPTPNGVELHWVLPKTRSDDVNSLDVLERYTISGAFTDSAEDFNAFKVTLTTTGNNWILSSSGYSGNCFHRPAGAGYQSYLTMAEAVCPDQGTSLTFKAMYILYQDRLSVDVSIDDGASFAEVWSVSGTFQGSWVDVQVPLDDFAGQDILIRFNYHPGTYYTTGGVWIDEIRIAPAQWYAWTAIHHVDELTAYQAEVTTTFHDQAENFDEFEVTSTTTDNDWILSSTGYTGECFYKPAGGITNRQYHLTSSQSFYPGAQTYIEFKTHYFLYADNFSVQISTDDGANFMPVWSASYNQKKNWTDVRIPLGSYNGLSVRIRFDYQAAAYYIDGGVWLDEIKLVDITNSEYLEYPVYHTLLSDLPAGTHTLAFQVWSGEQIQPRSEAFVAEVPYP
jgi:hypothetical protein